MGGYQTNPFNQDFSPMRDSLQDAYHPETNYLGNKIGQALSQNLNPKDKTIVDRIKQSVKGQPIEETLRKFSKDNADEINEEGVLIALSKINSNFYMGDIKDFITILKGQQNKPTDKLSIAETVQMISS